MYCSLLLRTLTRKKGPNYFTHLMATAENLHLYITKYLELGRNFIWATYSIKSRLQRLIIALNWFCYKFEEQHKLFLLLILHCIVLVSNCFSSIVRATIVTWHVSFFSSSEKRYLDCFVSHIWSSCQVLNKKTKISAWNWKPISLILNDLKY